MERHFRVVVYVAFYFTLMLPLYSRTYTYLSVYTRMSFPLLSSNRSRIWLPLKYAILLQLDAPMEQRCISRSSLGFMRYMNVPTLTVCAIFGIFTLYTLYLLPLKYEPSESSHATTMLTNIPMAPKSRKLALVHSLMQNTTTSPATKPASAA